MKDYSVYSFEQRSRDIAVYSKGAEKRIEKAILSGGSISGARSIEADRIAKYRCMAKTVSRKEAALLGGIIGSRVVKPVLTHIRDKVDSDIYTDTPVNRVIGKHKEKITAALNFMIETPMLSESVGIVIGGGIFPKMLSGAVMMAGGYKPSKAL